ncbi:hypothetical protein BYT27DRAFT_6764428 [Phlegmacium glaucopus]|nr:hypothetical protein BYT27DRAFT_6764428 [Phlegmacium glaucopus]
MRLALEEKERAFEEAKRRYAQMNVDEEDLDNEVAEKNSQRLSVANHILGKDGHKVEEVDDGEAFDFDEVNGLASSELEESDVEPVKKKKAKKIVRGMTRKEIEVMAEDIRGGKDDGHKKGTARSNPPAALGADPKKYQNAGLCKKAIRNELSEPYDPLQCGGLSNDDANATRPPSVPPPCHDSESVQPISTPIFPNNLKRDHTHKNNLVAVAENVLDSEVAVKGSQIKQSKPKKLKKPAASTTEPSAATAGGSSNGASDIATQFLQDPRWAKVFIPTITHAFYVSREPFLEWTPEAPAFLATVQRVFNMSFLNVTFTLTADNVIVNTAYQRLKSRKSKIASGTLNTVKVFFEKPEFAGQPEKIREYVRWALRGDGPAYYRIPTPKVCTVNRDHPNYIQPDGFLQSEFIHPLAQQFQEYAKNSVLSPALSAQNPPKGLYALILAAVERAFFAHRKGTFVKPPNFARDNTWRSLVDFYSHLDLLSVNCWKSMFEFNSGGHNGDDSLCGDESMISTYRAGLYIPLSPQKSYA